MPTSHLTFGYFPDALNISAGQINITTLPSLLNAVKQVEASEGVVDGWIYAPPQEVLQFGGGIRKRPFPSRIFGLPKTHKLQHASADDENHLVFHVWALSFFTGMRLTPTEAGFVDSTPLKPGALVDFLLTGRALTPAVERAEAFWRRHRSMPQCSKLFAGAVHALFLGHNRLLLQFEQFLLFYTAFDACFALAKALNPTRPPPRKHEARVAWMCELFGMAVPPWADPAAATGSEVAAIRNKTVHEGLFMGEPLGFALHGIGTGQNLTLEMEALICRLLVALLGGEHGGYVISPISTRQRFGLRLGSP